MTKAMIELNDVAFGYGDEFSLAVPKLQVNRGEKVACIGPSGTGKTTLINLMTGILQPDQGEVRLDGVDIQKLGEDARRRIRIQTVGMVFQQFELLEYLSALENILLPYHLNPALKLDAAAKARARKIAQDMGISRILNRKPRQLSQGERQRVAISRALVTEPALLIADEPTGNLDPENSDTILDLLFAPCEERGATLLVVTHDHGLLPRFDRVIDIMAMAEVAQA
ncbi:MAG: ABC transporter ATP-binding protein [Planctomycetota bacterium]